MGTEAVRETGLRTVEGMGEADGMQNLDGEVDLRAHGEE